MTWKFETVAGPFKGATGGVAWDGKHVYFTAVAEERLMRFDPVTARIEEFRRYTYRTNGLALGPSGEIYGGQEGGRRVVQFLAGDMSTGITAPTECQLEGRYHNFPCDLAVDRRGRVWFSDPYNPVPAAGPQMYPLLEHQSVLRLDRDRGWQLRRVTRDTSGPRAIALSADEQTLYVSDGAPDGKSPRELRAYPVNQDGTVGPFTVLHTFGSDHRGPHRGIEGMCIDRDGNILACAGWNRSGPGPLIYVFTPSGRILETHALPVDLPMRCSFGGPDLASLYLTSGDGLLLRADDIGRCGLSRK